MKFLDLDGLSYFTTKLLSKIPTKISELINDSGYSKVNNSTTNGNILIDNKETTVYTLPNADSSTLGGVKIGTNVSVSNGTISVKDATTEQKGVVQLTDSTTSTSTTTAATPNSVSNVLSEAKEYSDNLIDELNADCIKELSVNGTTITYTKGDGTISTIITQDTNTTYSEAGSSLGLVKSGGDVTISSGVITVNDDSHNHIIENVDGLQSALDKKAALAHSHDDIYYTEAEIDAKFDAIIEEGVLATSAEKLTTARNIGLSGGVTGTATSFDGSSDITIPVTSVSPSHIADGYTSKGFYINSHPENLPAIIPFINNDIAYLLKRGGSAVVTYDGVVQDVDISGVFDGSPSYWAIQPRDITEIVIELTLHKTFIWTNTVYVDMGATGWRAKNIKLEAINTNFADDVWTVLKEETGRTISQFKHTFNYTPVGASDSSSGFNKIRLTFSSWATEGSFRIAAIGILNYSSAGLRETFLPKDGGSVYGSIAPFNTDKFNLGSSSLKWNNVYANTFNGDLNGNATNATDADTLDGCHASEFQKAMDFPEINTNVLEYAENYPIIDDNGTFFTCRIYNGYNEPYANETIGSGDYYYYMHKIDSDWITIIAIDVRNTNMFIRNKHSGEWGEWKSISNNEDINTSNGYYTIKGTVSTLFTPTEEGAWYVTNGDDTFPYPYGLLEIRYGSYDKEYTVTYKTTGDDFKLYYNGWREESGGWIGWKDCVECDNADTVDGYHASDFVKLGYRSNTNWDTMTEAGIYRMDAITSQTSFINGMNGYGQLLVIRGSTGDTISQFYCNYNDNNIFTRSANGVGTDTINWTSWKRINDGGNADTVDGYHSYEIQTKSNDGNLFGGSDNTAFIQWDGSNYFWLKTPSNATAVNHSDTSKKSNSIASTGFGDTNFTYYQTGDTFYDNSGWCHYLISNHGSGENYYNYVIGLPFWSSPIYRRQDGNQSNRSAWHKFHTTETITYGTSSLVVGTAVLPEGHIYLQYE